MIHLRRLSDNRIDYNDMTDEQREMWYAAVRDIQKRRERELEKVARVQRPRVMIRTIRRRKGEEGYVGE